MTAPRKVGLWHERLADWILANPDKSISDAAPFFNCHMNTLYLIKNSAAFQKYFQERSRRLSAEVEQTMVNRLTGVADKAEALAEIALDQLTDRLESKGRDLPIGDLLSVTDLTMKRLGYGVTAPPAPVQVQVNNITSADLAKAREKMVKRDPAESLVAPALPPGQVVDVEVEG